MGTGCTVLDVDGDGWDDPQPLQLFQNQGGRSFTDRCAEAGESFSRPAVGRDLATGDFDRDGRLDLLVTDLEGPPRLLMNRRESGSARIGLRLQGSKSNRMALGAVVRMTTGTRTWRTEAGTGGSYLSSSSAVVHFGLGKEAGPVAVEIRWPSGHHTTLTDVPVNQYHVVHETRGRLSETPPGGAIEGGQDAIVSV